MILLIIDMKMELCKIIAKSETLNSMLLLHPCGEPLHDTKLDRLIDIYEEYYKLAPAKSMCLRKIKSNTHMFYTLYVMVIKDGKMLKL